MKDLVLYIVKQLVTNPDKVVVDEQSSNGEVTLFLTVDPTDMGIVIGKAGQTIKSIRRLLTVRAMADNVRINLQLNEVGRPEEETSVEPEDQIKSDKSETSEVSKKAEKTDTEPADSTDSTETTESTDAPISSDLSEPKEQSSEESSQG